ncbi:MAG TPA: DNA-directed RNA polymerase subunit beta, partial [Candidatus Atribacteria bacterium]|nr:DNA-directed RNA polymerase subunit beta [Candidatus Atribacteria bacterium]
MSVSYIERQSFAKIPSSLELPDFIEIQKKSFDWFLQGDVPPENRKKQGLQEVFLEVFPVQDFTGRLVLEFVNYRLEEPVFTVKEAKEKGRTYSVPLHARIRLIDRQTNGIKEQDVYMGDIPLMTEWGTFVVNGAERVVVTQLVRSPGVFFSREVTTTGKVDYGFKIIPNRGAWLEFGIDTGDIIYVRVDKRRKINAVTLVRALGYEDNEEILSMFDYHPIIRKTLEKDPSTNYKEAVVEIFRRLRPSEPPTEENTRDFMRYLFFDPRRYDLGEVGRYKINNKLKLEERVIRIEEPVLAEDIVIDLQDKKCLRDISLLGEDIDTSRYRIAGKKGERINRRLAQELEKLNEEYPIEYIKVFSEEELPVKIYVEREDTWEVLSEDLEGRILSEAVVDEITGEVLVEKGKPLTLGLIRDLRGLGIERVRVKKYRTLTPEDVVGSIRYFLNLIDGIGYEDDIDHLGNRRARMVGELLQN